MDIQTTCRSCEQHLVVDSAATGQQTSCPTCSTPFVIPAVARAAFAPSAGVPDTRLNGMAITSMVLGISSVLCLGLFTGIPAIILGHKAYGRARRLPDKYAGGGMAIAGFILGYISTLACVAFIAFHLIYSFYDAVEATRIHPETQMLESENNLKEIGLAFREWAGDHNDQYPFNVSRSRGGTLELCSPDGNGFEQNPVPTFMVLSNELENNPRILVCPNDNTKQQAVDFAHLTAHNISYQLRIGTNVNDDNGNEILAVDPINGLVLHCDGTVEHDYRYRKSQIAR